MPFTFDPIGVLHTPFTSRADTPRQPYVAKDARGIIELFEGFSFEDALSDLTDWSHLWVLYVFHENVEKGWRPRVQPPRSRGQKKGLFSTRSPHRPNPIGLSLVALDRVEGRNVHVRGIDAMNDSPVLDIKPYLPFAESIPNADTGWIAKDPDPPHEVVFTLHAQAQLAWLAARGEATLSQAIAERLALGPEPRAYRRIRREGDRLRLALNAWRVFFHAQERVIHVDEIVTGYKASSLMNEQSPEIELHRAFTEAFPVK